MKKISSSPQRYSFQKQKYLERRQSEGRTPENDPDTAAMADFFDRALRDHIAKEEDPDWQRNNMEYDLRTTDWILEKVRSSENYAQNLYAAICNNDFQKTHIADGPDSVVSILKDGLPTWGCSWRYAGGIIADMRGEGDYIDWYCSGIRNSSDDEEENKIWDERKYVAESVVTDEIRDDLKKLGWRVINEDEEDPLL